MTITVTPVELTDILRMRDMYRQEMNCQIVHDSYHARGFSRPYLLRLDGAVAGYGSVGDYDSRLSEVVTEFYVLPAHRGEALFLMRELIAISEATQIESQTNDRLLTLMLYDCCPLDSIASNTILFEDARTTCLPAPNGAVFRRLTGDTSPPVFAEGVDTDAEWGIEVEGRVVGVGGFLCHYNPPYGDVYMGVAETHRQQGIGSYLVQEIKRVCYEAGRRPAARCNAKNEASRRTLQRAGLLPCARFLRGMIGK
jgi:GNAT superfamily N-acetyltransferase